MLTAADIMTTTVITVAPDTPVREIAKLLYARRISGVPVVDAKGALARARLRFWVHLPTRCWYARR
jgi:CBS domain-containing protein